MNADNTDKYKPNPYAQFGNDTENRISHQIQQSINNDFDLQHFHDGENQEYDHNNDWPLHQPRQRLNNANAEKPIIISYTFLYIFFILKITPKTLAIFVND